MRLRNGLIVQKKNEGNEGADMNLYVVQDTSFHIGPEISYLLLMDKDGNPVELFDQNAKDYRVLTGHEIYNLVDSSAGGDDDTNRDIRAAAYTHLDVLNNP